MYDKSGLHERVSYKSALPTSTCVLAVEEVSCHEELQCYLSGDGELWNLSATVGIPDLVSEILAHLGQDMGSTGGTE